MRPLLALALAALLTAVACGDDDDDPSLTNSCVGSKGAECTCQDGTKSTQTCDASGNALDACGCKDGTSTTKLCVPGKSEDCTCPGGGKSSQACKSDGSGYDACQCESAGVGGSGGSGGKGSDPTTTPGCETASFLDSFCVGKDTSKPHGYSGCKQPPAGCVYDSDPAADVYCCP